MKVVVTNQWTFMTMNEVLVSFYQLLDKFKLRTFKIEGLLTKEE